ncbi:MAG: YtxH domain-containing protein [Candidatus Leucobacter sulfamidivorax]|nr:YtxH domain-containing protein [Candidatus Leucobacter sulfamidivorax]
MKGKIAFLLGAAVGYVLGTRAGRERYEQIKRGAQRIWNTEPVQRGVHVVRDAVDERADEVKQAARKLGAQLLGKLSEQAAGKPREAASKASSRDADADDGADSADEVDAEAADGSAKTAKTAKAPAKSTARGSSRSAQSSSKSKAKSGTAAADRAARASGDGDGE